MVGMGNDDELSPTDRESITEPHIDLSDAERQTAFDLMVQAKRTQDLARAQLVVVLRALDFQLPAAVQALLMAEKHATEAFVEAVNLYKQEE